MGTRQPASQQGGRPAGAGLGGWASRSGAGSPGRRCVGSAAPSASPPPPRCLRRPIRGRPRGKAAATSPVGPRGEAPPSAGLLSRCASTWEMPASRRLRERVPSRGREALLARVRVSAPGTLRGGSVTPCLATGRQAVLHSTSKQSGEVLEASWPAAPASGVPFSPCEVGHVPLHSSGRWHLRHGNGVRVVARDRAAGKSSRARVPTKDTYEKHVPRCDPSRSA